MEVAALNIKISKEPEKTLGIQMGENLMTMIQKLLSLN